MKVDNSNHSIISQAHIEQFNSIQNSHNSNFRLYIEKI